MERFVKQPYFEYLIQAMLGLGYGLLAKVQIRADELMYGYHVPVISARETRLFFERPGKALILQANFSEANGICGEEGYSYSTSGNLYANCNEWETGQENYEAWVESKIAELAESIGREAAEERWWEMDGWPEAPYGVGRRVDGGGGDWTVNADFGHMFQYDWNWHGEFLSELTTTEVASKLHGLCEPTFLLLAKQFTELQVTSFPPHNSLLGSERPFWGKFPFGRLKAKVKGRIWGSDFPWRPERRDPWLGLPLHPLYQGPHVPYN